MGRASRRKYAAEEFNRGDAGRMVLAHGAAHIVLCTDLRVQQYAEWWKRERERIAAVGGYVLPPGVEPLADTAEQWMRLRVAFEVTMLADLLRGMGVPERFAPTAAKVLINVAFPIAVHNATCPPADRQLLMVSVDGLSAVPAGRKPRHHGQDVERWVDWWYRNKIKDPSDSIYALAKEYADREKRYTRADSVVVDGIQRVENLLNRVVPPNRGKKNL